jgi:FkbM family methyltransferase
MFGGFGKKIALALIRKKLTLPENVLIRFQEYAYTKLLLDRLEINCIIDVGAHHGQTVNLLRGLGFNGLIYSFEPQKHAFSVLEKNFSNDSNWKGFQIALGDSSSHQKLRVNVESTDMSTLLDFHQPPEAIGEEEVRVERLDSLLPSLMDSIKDEPRVFLKIDAEGYDLNVFRGSIKSLSHILLLQVEVFIQPVYRRAPSYFEAFRDYERAGFRLTNSSIVLRSESGQIVCMNCLLERRSSALGRKHIFTAHD